MAELEAHRRRRLRRRRAAEIRGLSAERLSLLLDGCLTVLVVSDVVLQRHIINY